MPAATRGAEPPGQRPGNRLPELTSVRILLIDDDPQAGALIEMALADAPFTYSLDMAGNAHAGMACIAADNHDIYIVDQLLPDGRGIELIHTAKEHGVTRPFILMTGCGSEALDVEASREGAADYVEKHMVAAHLERSIRYALRNWQATRTLHDREEQLRHSQKMEAIGRLAGGVAHDFNNLLTAIVGYTDLILEHVGNDSQTRREVGEIRKAADRATSLTRQLLAFSRKQFLNPTVLDVNDVIAGLVQMLPRVIGEHIKTVVELGEALAPVKADASQLEQVCVNLVLNARDAMHEGGVLTIETVNVTLDDERLSRENLALAPGPYVMLAITDTGVGMDGETRARAFEPFFTTKPKGKGTGLGLATVYGIVDQSGGAVSIDSRPGDGTVVRVYLPATAAVERRKHTPPPPILSDDGGTERVLLVEDNDSVRELAARALRRRGYVVHEARNADEAIEWAARAPEPADVLVTDIVMPGLSGPNLASRLLQQSPSLRVLYMSGYTEEARAVEGAYLAGVPLLQKPFTPAQLAERVRLTLDSTSNTT